MVVAYRLSPLTYAVGRRLMRTPYITLFNIAAGEAIAPEFIQDECNGPALARALAPLLDDPGRRRRQAARQSAALDRMGRGVVGDPGAAAASAVLALVQPRLSTGV